MKKILLTLFLSTVGLSAFAAHNYKEKDYQAVWCKAQNGVMEYRLDDSARVDCLTDKYAAEFDFSTKWAESIGQSLYYGIKTHKEPAVVLIMENPSKDMKYLHRLKAVAEKYGVTVFTMNSL